MINPYQGPEIKKAAGVPDSLFYLKDANPTSEPVEVVEEPHCLLAAMNADK